MVLFAIRKKPQVSQELCQLKALYCYFFFSFRKTNPPLLQVTAIRFFFSMLQDVLLFFIIQARTPASFIAIGIFFS